MRVINISLSELETKMLMIGFEGENQITQVRIDAAEILTDYPNATPTLIVKPLFGFAYPVIVAMEGTDVVWEIDNSVLSSHGDGEIQLTFTEGTVIAKSYVGRIRIKRSLAVNGEVPDPIETWEQAATAKLAEVDAQISELEDMVEAAEAAKDEAQDIVDDATADIQAAGAAQVGNVNTAGSTQVSAVQAKGTEVLNSIPSDYTELSNDVTGLKSAINDMNTATTDDVGKALKAKTVSGGKVTEWEFGETGVAVDPTLSIEGKAADAKATGDAINNVENELFSFEELTLANRANLKRLNPANGGWGSAQGYQIVAGAVTVGDTIRIDADDRWQFQTTNSDGTRIGETYEAGTYTVEVPENALYVVLSTPTESNAHVYLLSSKLDGFSEAIAETNQRVDNLGNVKMDKTEFDPDGLSIDVSGVEYGAWRGSIGEAISPATNNNRRRIHVDLSEYVGYTMTVNASTGLNPAATNGCMQALCDENGIIVETYYESNWKNGVWTKVITEETTQLYLAYTYASTANLAVNVISPKAEQFAKIPVLEQAIEKAVKPLSFQNLCENANIDDLTGFTAGVATISAENHVLTITPTARNNETEYTVPTALKEGHRYYMSVWLKSNYTGSGMFIRARIYKSGSATQSIGSVNYNGQNPDEWQKLSFVTSAAPAYNTLRLNIFCNSTGLEVMYAKQIVILDLTDIFGEGNEPNAGTIEQLISESNNGDSFFAGTLPTNIITNSIYPNDANNKPIFVGVSGYVMNVNAKYSANKDIRYKVGKAGSNSLFNWRGFDYIDNSNQIVSPEVDLTQTIAVITDWFGPHKLRAANNADGDMPDSDNFTGGNHAYNGDSSGTPTARTASYAFYVDGRKVSSFLGYAYYVDVYWENRVQATNTKKSDGTGREVLKETFHMHFDGEKWTLNGMLEPLEDLSSWSYYGIQMSRASAYNGYIFYHDSPDNRTWHSTRSSSNSAINACHTITMHDGADYFEMHVGTDGLGNFALIGNENSFFSTDNKTYSNLIKSSAGFAANSVYTYDGWYKWYNMDFSE